MRERAKELQRERLEAAKRGAPPRSQMSFGQYYKINLLLLAFI